MIKWENLPERIKNEKTCPYYELLQQKKIQILWKRVLDFFCAVVLTVLLSPVMLLIAAAIKLDTKGPIFYRQTRVTRYGMTYRIFKFRTMITGADKKGPLVTSSQDDRVTKVGKLLRKIRLDELPQLLNVLKGEMSFVGTRPEVEKYVAHYTDEMKATLLMPAGITSRASIEYKDEERLLESAENADEVYIHQVLPEKMKYNLRAIEKFSFWDDIKTMFATVIAVIK